MMQTDYFSCCLQVANFREKALPETGFPAIYALKLFGKASGVGRRLMEPPPYLPWVLCPKVYSVRQASR
jgi:hypothetical protein